MLAEQQVLAVSGNVVQDGTKLHTCALRLAGVYGPGERRHLPRIVVSRQAIGEILDHATSGERCKHWAG